MDLKNVNNEYKARVGDFDGELNQNHFEILGMTIQVVAMAHLGYSLYDDVEDVAIAENPEYAARHITRLMCKNLQIGKHVDMFSKLQNAAVQVEYNAEESARLSAGKELGFLSLVKDVSASKHTLNPITQYAFYYAEDLDRFKRPPLIAHVGELSKFYADQTRHNIIERGKLNNGQISSDFEIVSIRKIALDADFYSGLYLSM